ncbi:DUF2635 domain-containing protein [Brevundimonas sp.]|uniref:DUF2635 domain-containing protein n=1 Tax=Brevundimonas sp. TaxID=1871086 RepID=UPI003D6CC7B2
MSRAKLKPAPGRRPLHPETGRPLDLAGETVELTAYWQRRIADEDAVVVGKTKES